MGAVLTVALAGIWQMLPASAQTDGFSISGTQLIDANGNPFIMRGSTHPDVWFQQEFESLEEISDLGADTIRVVLGSGERDWGVTTPARLQMIVDECKAQQVICVLEVHDTTGFGEEAGAASLDEAVDFWEGMYDVLEGEEAYTLINIGNEPIGNNNAGQWTQATVDAVERMRDIGFQHTLVVDAPNWGQDWEQIMLNNAPTVAAADDLGNTLFSVHMYAVYTDPQTVIDYFDAFEAMNLPLIVGEYGDIFQGQEPAWDTVQSEAQARGIGWIAWSYSGNNGGDLDQVLNFDPNQMTQTGERMFLSQYGIQNTAERASVFDDIDPTDTPTSISPTGCDVVYPAPTGLTATSVTSNSVTLEWDETTFGLAVQISRDGQPVGTTNDTTFTDTGLTSDTTYSYSVSVIPDDPECGTDEATISVTTEGTVGTGDCSAEITVVNDWGSGWHGNVTVTADQGSVDGWILTWTWPGGQGIQSHWNADLSTSGSTVTAGDVGWNGSVANGQTREVFGFIGTGNSVSPAVTCNAA